MKDWLFYPIVIALVGGMIAYALSFSDTTGTREAVTNEIVIEGRDLQTLFAAEGTTFSIAGDASNPAAYAVLSAHVSRQNAPPSAGVFITLSPAYETKFAGQDLRITVNARKGRANPLDRFEVAYFTVGAGDSGWQVFELGNDFRDFSFTFTPGLPNGAASNDFVGIWPDNAGRGRTMDVKSLKVEIVAPGGEAP